MSIQDIFYTLASISILLWIFFLIFLIYVVWQVQKSVTEVKEKIEAKAAHFMSLQNLTSGPVAKSVVVMATGFIARKIGSYFKSKKKHESES